MTLYPKSFAQSLGLISTGLWDSITNTSGRSRVLGQDETSHTRTVIAEGLSQVISAWRKAHIARSNLRIVAVVLNVRCLPLTEQLTLLNLCESGEPLSFYVRPDLTSVWKVSTRTLVIGRGVKESHTTSSLGVKTSIETLLDSREES